MSGPVAAIDCGTNAVRLLVAEVDERGRLLERTRLMRIVRLGEGVDRTGEFAEAALERTFAALDEYAQVIAAHGATAVRFVATSASRDVSNRQAFVAGVTARIGVPPDVITGAEEAALSFAGAVRGLPPGRVTSPALVVDIGGGSTEFVLGADRPEFAASVDIGCVRMTERHLHDDPPTSGQVAASAADIDEAVARAAGLVPFERAGSLVGLAGSVTTVAAMAMSLDRYDATILHGLDHLRGRRLAGGRPTAVDDPCRACRAALHAPWPRRRDRWWRHDPAGRDVRWAICVSCRLGDGHPRWHRLQSWLSLMLIDAATFHVTACVAGTALPRLARQEESRGHHHQGRRRCGWRLYRNRVAGAAGAAQRRRHHS